MPQRFYSSGSIPRDTVRSMHGDPWATVQNLAKKIRRRPNGDRSFSAWSPRDSSWIIARRSTDVYKGKLAGRWPTDSCAVTCRSPQDHPAVYTDDCVGPSTSQVQDAPVEMSGDNDGSTQQLSNLFTTQQDEQIAAFYERYPMFYDMGYSDYKNKKKRVTK